MNTRCRRLSPPNATTDLLGDSSAQALLKRLHLGGAAHLPD